MGITVGPNRVEITSNDVEQLQAAGMTESNIDHQLKNFTEGFPSVALSRPCTVGDGILRLSEQETIELSSAYDRSESIVKFVPASGAATRMFKALFEALEGKSTEASDTFVNSINNFAFAEDVKHAENVIAGTILESGLGYGQLPKGLIKFHKYEAGNRTAIEEHLVEGGLYGGTSEVNLHFTISPEHESRVKELLSQVVSKYEKEFGLTYNVNWSFQKSKTNTCAIHADGSLVRSADGKLLLRPSGHGALLANLAEIDADLIFIKNVDNVLPDSLKADTVTYKKVIAACLQRVKKEVAQAMDALDREEAADLKVLSELLSVDLAALSACCPTDLARFLNRPIRVCGMVKNEGEPGGGPYWVESNGKVSLQIVEKAQVDLANDQQRELFEGATHFNPVDLAVCTKNYRGERFDLTKYTDPATGFISEKSLDGKTIKVQELPGLWNGAMANWLTVFVEVPLSTFSPVKTVNDLLKPEHQA